MPNQNPEQLARDRIDAALLQSGWLVQHKKESNLNAAVGVALREYQTDIGPENHVLFVNKTSRLYYSQINVLLADLDKGVDENSRSRYLRNRQVLLLSLMKNRCYGCG